jgi:citrate lyase beta subunit
VAPSAKAAARDVVGRVFAGAPANTGSDPYPHPGWGENPPPSGSTIPEKSAPEPGDSASIRTRPHRLVRLNGLGTPWFDDDLALAARLPLDGLCLPKATPEAVDALGTEGPPIVAIVETAAGLRLGYETACRPRVCALVLGAADLGAELGLEPRDDGLEILYARSQLVVDSAAARIRPPFDVVHLQIDDREALEAECRLARSLGFRGKACIHPDQVDVVNRLFGPTESEIAWARRVLDMFEEQGEGVIAFNGTMIDLPVVERARRVLREAERSGG